MTQSSYLRMCKSCGEDFAKSVKECPHCGKKVQSGRLLMLIIGVGCLAMAAAFGIPVNKSQPDKLENIVAAAVDSVNTAELASVFNPKNKQMSPQAQSKAAEITGKIVQWNLEVFVATQSGDFYQVVTQSTPDVPGTLLRVYPRNNQQKNYLDNIKPGSRIQVKGKISGTQQGRIKIDPAIII